MYHVTCSGADLIRRLCSDPEKFLARPYGLHIVMLCTTVDDEAIDWLLRYEMALDSVTGPDAAFLMFYNETALSAKPSHPGRKAATALIDVSARTLRMGTAELDGVLRYDPEVQVSRDVLVRSMTYASDTVGRELGILDQLPCIVLFDDPNSGDFYLLPLDGDLGHTMSEIRTLLATYGEGEAHTEYLQAAHAWHATNDRLATKRRNADRLKLEFFRGRTFARRDTLQRLTQAEAELRAGRPKEFRRYVNLVWERDSPPGTTWHDIRMISNQVGELRSLAVALGRGTPSLTTERAVTTLGAHWTPDDLPGVVRALELDADRLTDQLMLKLGHLTESCEGRLLANPSAMADPDMAEPEWLRAELECRRIERLLQGRLGVFTTMRRPSVAKYVDKIVVKRRRKSASRIIRRSVGATLDQGPTLLDAMSKGINLLSD